MTKKAYGDPEQLHLVANKDYAADHPKLSNFLAAFKLDDKQFGTLEDTVVNKFAKGQEKEAAKAWLKENPEQDVRPRHERRSCTT